MTDRSSFPQDPKKARRCVHGVLVWFGHECGECESAGEYRWERDANPIVHNADIDPDAIRAKVRRLRAEQGLPPTVENPTTLQHVADLMRSADKRKKRDDPPTGR